MIVKNNLLLGDKGLSKFDIRFCLGLAFCDIRPIRNHQLIGFTPIDEQVKISQEVRVVFKYFVIGGA